MVWRRWEDECGSGSGNGSGSGGGGGRQVDSGNKEKEDIKGDEIVNPNGHYVVVYGNDADGCCG